MNSISSVLVTGGAGYVGSRLITDLVNSDYKVRSLDAMFFNPDQDSEFFKNNSVEFVNGDIRNNELLESCLDGIDCVVHLGAITGPLCDKSPAATRQINELATKKLVELCLKKDVKRLFFASTCSNYGSNLSIVNEQTPVNSLSLYSETKVNLESLILSSNNSNLATCVLRFSTVFGISPIMRFDLLLQELILNAIIHKKIQVFGPNFWRPLIHVNDASNACIKCIESSSELISGEIYNVGSNNQNFTKLDLAKLVQEYYPGIDIEVQEFKKDPRNYKVSFDKIQQKLGFITKNSVRDGVAEIVDGINNNTLIYKNSDFLTRAKLAEKIPVL